MPCGVGVLSPIYIINIQITERDKQQLSFNKKDSRYEKKSTYFDGRSHGAYFHDACNGAYPWHCHGTGRLADAGARQAHPRGKHLWCQCRLRVYAHRERSPHGVVAGSDNACLHGSQCRGYRRGLRYPDFPVCLCQLHRQWRDLLQEDYFRRRGRQDLLPVQRQGIQ